MQIRSIMTLILLVLSSLAIACQLGPQAASIALIDTLPPETNTQIETNEQDTSHTGLHTFFQDKPEENDGVSDDSSSTPDTDLLSQTPSAFEGYTLFSPITSKSTYLIDNGGQLIHSWESSYTGQTAYLLEDSSLLRTVNNSDGINGSTFNAGGGTGRIERYSWDGDLIWFYELNNEQYRLHHDIDILPNGNILAVAWESKTTTESVAAGRSQNLLPDNALWPDMVIEIEPSGNSGGNIVWEWHVWDHLIQDHDPSKDNYGVITDHPELINLNFVNRRAAADWNHINSVDYNAELDQIVLSVHGFNEIWIIDHSTTPAEASGHNGGLNGMGGDLLYRWGNPQAYDRGSSSDQVLFGQHDAEWIDNGLPGEGSILIFNNGKGRPDGDYSSIDEITPPLNTNGTYNLISGQPFGPDHPDWLYTAKNPTDFYGDHISGQQRLPNGNTLICEGTTGSFFEVTLRGEIVWSYTNPIINLPRGGPEQGQGPQNQPPSDTPRPNKTPSGNNTPNPGNSVFKIERYAPDYPGLMDKDLTPKGMVE